MPTGVTSPVPHLSSTLFNLVTSDIDGIVTHMIETAIRFA